jgi:hypothetical protein
MIDLVGLTNAVRLATFDNLRAQTGVPAKSLDETATSDDRFRQFEAVAHQPGHDTLVRITVEALPEGEAR